MPEGYERGAPAAGAFGGGGGGFDERRAGENAADGFALDANSLPVDDAEVDEALFPGGFEIGLDDAFDIAGRDGVEVENVGDGEFKYVVFGVHTAINMPKAHS